MLRKINIQNVVLIERQEIEFGSGLNVLSGETGAGKSILLDSIGLISGSRAESSKVRRGEEKALIVGHFDSPKSINLILDDNDIDVDDELILKRSLKADGKSKAYVNGEPVTRAVLSEIGANAVEIHSQFETRGLLDETTHIDLLDGRIEGWKDRRKRVLESFEKFKNLRKQLDNKIKEAEKARLEEDYLRHIFEELEGLNYIEGEEEGLDNRRRKLKNSGEIIEFYSKLLEALDNQEQLGAVQRQLYKNPESEAEAAAEIDGLIEGASENINEALRIAQSKLNEIDAGEDNLDDIEARLSEVRTIARKHNITCEELPNFYDEVAGKLKLISGNEDEIDSLKAELVKAREAFLKLAQDIRDRRKLAAKELQKNIHNELDDLKMENARFEVNFEELEEGGWNSKGIDKITFLVATNKGSSAGSIAKVASGGELSRIMLALKAISSNEEQKVIIFDEIDAGLGGATADSVGKRLKKISKNNQVLVVTHSPQVASYADNHFYISKKDVDGSTITSVDKLSDSESKDEIARMISGADVTKEALAQAEKLLKSE